MTGWNLPPGCTDADIDRAFGGPDPIECSECGTLNDESETECRNCGFRFVEEPDLDAARIDYEVDRNR